MNKHFGAHSNKSIRNATNEEAVETSLVVKPTSTSYFTTTVYTVIIAPVNKNSNMIYIYVLLTTDCWTKNIFVQIY